MRWPLGEDHHSITCGIPATQWRKKIGFVEITKFRKQLNFVPKRRLIDAPYTRIYNTLAEWEYRRQQLK